MERGPRGMDEAVSCRAEDAPIPDSRRRDSRKQAIGRSLRTESIAFREEEERVAHTMQAPSRKATGRT